MADEIVFYHNPFSRARIAHWMLEEVGAPYRTVVLDFDKGETKTPQFLAINPMGKLPAIVHGEVVVTEGAAICAYLAEVFPQAGLAPAPGDPRLGPYYRWLFFGAGCVEPAFIDAMFKRPEPERKGALGYGSLGDVLNALKGALAQAPYMTGDTFTAADLYMSSQIWWGARVGVPGLKDDPVFDAYVARCSDRPAWVRATTADDGSR